MKTALMLQPNSVDYQKVAALLSTVLVFKVAQEQYKANRKQEDKLDKSEQAELENCKREAELKVLTKEYDSFKDDFVGKLQAENDFLKRAAGENPPPRREKQLVKVKQDSSQLMVKYKPDDMYMSPVEKLFRLDTDMAYSMFLNLVIGIKEAAFYLAVSFVDGYGAVVNEFLAHLTMAIGVKLGDKDTIDLVNAAPDEPLRDDAQKLAGKCVAQIRKNAKEIGNKQITYQEAIGYGKILDQMVQANSKESFEKNLLQGGWVKEFAQFVVVTDGKSSHASTSGYSESSPLMGGQQNSSYDDCCTIL